MPSGSPLIQIKLYLVGNRTVERDSAKPVVGGAQ
jgi:hypothetical protein